MRPGQDTITEIIADRWAGETCWLNGKEAKVTGRLNRFATVGTLDGSQRFEYSWHTVNRVMLYKGREFIT